MTKIQTFMNCNKLKLNPEKTKFMIMTINFNGAEDRADQVCKVSWYCNIRRPQME